MKKTIGILAHVDAGKTSFSEQLLYHAQVVRSCGRVDHQTSFLDIDPLEKARGITIFSDQASFEYDGDDWYLVDTPGHADFSSEMERALSVMDYAVLLVSCVEGIQSHSETIWRLLEQYNIPTFLFLNKTDRAGADPEAVLRSLRARFSSDILDLRSELRADGTLEGAAIEQVAEGDEALLDALFSTGYAREPFLNSLIAQIRERRLFPLMAGSALRDEGIDAFLHALSMLTKTDYEAHVREPLQARAAKLRFDAQGNRMVFLKLTAGTLSARAELPTPEGTCKVNELRIYSGAKYRQVASAAAGDLVAVLGLRGVKCGDRLGAICEKSAFLIEPLMTAQLIYPAEIHATQMLEKLRQLEDEEPMLRVRWNAAMQEIEVQLMGKMQMEILRELAKRRFGIDISFGTCRIAYKETIAETSYGIGHYEPLKHYAEVQLMLEPLSLGSGIQFASACHVDELALNWQRLIETHVFEYAHRGVLIGAPLTDVRITLLTGRAHIKHTEGGDFREATYRAIRNALMYAQNVLLEPICRFELRAPSEALGRIMSDMTRMHAKAEPPAFVGEDIHITGTVPFARFSGYTEALTALTHGRGSCTYQLSHYAPCDDAEAVIAERNYNPRIESPDSVFCYKGAGVLIPWDEVRAHAHLHSPANP